MYIQSSCKMLSPAVKCSFLVGTHSVNQSLIFFKLINLFLAALGLRYCTQAFFSCGEWGLLFVVVCGLLIAVASLVAEHGLWARGLNSCGSRGLECGLSSCGTRA